VENQLFPSLIGISPLITIHYKSLLRLRIRSSSFLSKTFNLIIISSRRFRVYKNLCSSVISRPSIKGAINLKFTRLKSIYSKSIIYLKVNTLIWIDDLSFPFLFAFRLINFYNSLTHYAKGTSFSSDCFFHIISSSFHSIFMVLFIIPSRYFYTINHWFIFLVWGWFLIIFNFFSLLSFSITFYIYGILPFFFYFRSTCQVGNSLIPFLINYSYYWFRSPLLSISLLISFPPTT